MSNVIQFPTKERIEESLVPDDDEKSIGLRGITNILVSDMMEILNEHGYYLDETRDTHTLSLVMDSIYSMLLGIEDIEHPLQGVSEMMYDPENAGSEMTVLLTDIED